MRTWFDKTQHHRPDAARKITGKTERGKKDPPGKDSPLSGARSLCQGYSPLNPPVQQFSSSTLFIYPGLANMRLLHS